MNWKNRSAVYDYLENKQIQHAYIGYKYLTTALLLCLDDADLRFKTCALYQDVAKRHSPATASQVERAVRHSLRKLPTKTTTSEFIARAVDEINREWEM